MEARRGGEGGLASEQVPPGGDTWVCQVVIALWESWDKVSPSTVSVCLAKLPLVGGEITSLCRLGLCLG